MTLHSNVDLLAHVLREGRVLLGESPEQVGGSLGISGRTIRRIEAGTSAHPRDITLTTLAGYYGMNPAFIRWLVRAETDGGELEMLLARQAELAGVHQPADRPLPLALMLARHKGTQRTSDRDVELEALHADLSLLNERRRQMVRQLVDELRLAQSEEVRRRESAG